MVTLKNIERISIGIPEINMAPHWAYYIAGSIFIILSITSLVYTYYFITHPISDERLLECKGFKKLWLKNRVAFCLMTDVIFILISIFFMVNGS
ncbi:MAG: hypothetical protein ACRC1F_02110 [Metamycoplasmataceae bacterium]